MANKDIVSVSFDLLGSIFKLYKATKEYMSAPSQDEINKLKSIRIYTENYRGRVRYTGKPISITTKFYRIKDTATFQLKKEANEKGYNALINVGWDYKQCSESTPKGGTYYYKEWRAYGKAVKI